MNQYRILSISKWILLCLSILSCGILSIGLTQANADDEATIPIGYIKECSEEDASKLRFCVQNLTDTQVVVGLLYMPDGANAESGKKGTRITLGPKGDGHAAGGPLEFPGTDQSLFVISSIDSKDYVSSTKVKTGDVFDVDLSQTPATDDSSKTVTVLTLIWRDYRPGTPPPSGN